VEADKGILEMKILVNVISSFVFFVQFISFVLNILNQEEPESTIESLYQYFYITTFLCSLCTVVFFVVTYNFNFKAQQKKVTNCLFLVITILGLYIPILQIFVLNDFVLTSCVLLIFDSYTLLKIMKNLVSKSDYN